MGLTLGDAVEVREVGPRDGLQGLAGGPHTPDVRADLVRRLARCGITRQEVGSFVSERAVPSMRGSNEVIELVRDIATSLEVLVVNERGATLAAGSSCDVVVCVVAATDSFSQRNVRMNRAQALETAASVARIAQAGGKRCIANIAVAFGCPDEGEVPIDRVITMVKQLREMSFDQLFLSDTIGVAGPRSVTALVEATRDAIDIEDVGLHLHDTNGLGLVNARAGLEAGVRRFDASIGGIGGCPFAPGASGNVASEDLVNLFNHLGIETHIDLDQLVDTARWLGATLPTELPGHVAHARRKTFVP